VVLVILLFVGFKSVRHTELQVEHMEPAGVRDAWPGRAGAAQTRNQTLMIWIPDCARLKSRGDCVVPIFLATADHRTRPGSESFYTAWDEKWVQLQELVHRLALGGSR
jgi:hypothetical protein